MTSTSPLFPEGPLQVPPLGVTLRPYQQDAIAGIFAWFDEHTGNPLVVLPTGAGKSLIVAGFIHAVLSAYQTERILVLTHVRELIAQNHAQMLRCWPDAPAGIYSAGLGRREHDAPILFGGIQSLWKKAAMVGWVDLILVDECHLLPKDGFGMYRAFLNDLLSMNSKLKVIGLTATPFRTDSGSLDSGQDRLFHGIAYQADLVRLIADGFLSPVVSKGTKAPINTVGVHKQGGEFVARELEAEALRDGCVRKAVEEIVGRGQDRRAWLVFCCGIEHANAVADEFARLGISCATVFGDTPGSERDDVVAAFKSGELRCIVNVNVLTTGFDAPQVDLIALLRPTCSPGLFVQMIGRGLRVATGKRDCLVLDFGGNVQRHGPIDDVKIKQPGQPTGEVRARECPTCQTLVAVAARVCPECGFEWAVIAPERTPDHDEKPDETSALVRGSHPTGGIEKWDVQHVSYRQHNKPGKPPSVCVEYRCGFHQTVREWVCLEHQGFARRKAEMWWRHHGGKAPVPDTVDVALIRIECGELLEPVTVTVDVRGEYPELKGVKLGQPDAGLHEFEGPASTAPATQIPHDEIPF